MIKNLVKVNITIYIYPEYESNYKKVKAPPTTYKAN